jgi:exodeoxyribonuclease-3
MLKISTFNVNSIRARLPRFLEWIKISKPDIICLQELKCEENNFPFEIMMDAGYNCAIYGQKTFNGVGILSKFKIEEVVKGIDFDTENPDSQARYIEAIIAVKNNIFRISSIYIPNGGADLALGERIEDSEKFKYKINFFNKLQKRLNVISKYDEYQILAGDFNVAIEAIDIFDPKKFENQILFHPLERQSFRAILNSGYIDIFRTKYPKNQYYSWWDYRGNSYNYNKGARIDYILTSPNLADKVDEVIIEDKNIRNQEKASDHCPVSAIMQF